VLAQYRFISEDLLVCYGLTLLFVMPCSILLGFLLSQAAEDFMSTCLIRAHINKMQSIALPALGTGNLGIPATESAAFMFRRVEHFSRNNPQSNLKYIYFVIFDAPTMKVCSYYAVRSQDIFVSKLVSK